MICKICPRNCSIDRDCKIGFCGMSNTLKLAKVGKFMWEEPCISGENGSGAIFFSGCNLKCCFCQNHKISSGGFGKEITIDRLVEIFHELENMGVNNINLVSPTQYTMQIIQALNIYKPSIPIVWNSNGYESVDTIKLLENYVDIYLVDCKFFDKDLSQKYCKAGDYFEKDSQCILEMLRQQPNVVIKDNIMQKGVIVRHLVMPNYTDDSLKILDFLATIKQEFLLSIMGQYTPYYLALNDDKINRKLKPIEYKKVINYAIKLGLDKGFIQDLDSATQDFIPDFDLSGV